MMSSQAQKGLVFKEEEIFGRGSQGRTGYSLPAFGCPTMDPRKLLSDDSLRIELEGFPRLSEPEVIRHYTRISQWNFSVDTNFYPLGSCTMKYNPKVNEAIARFTGFTNLHPLASDDHAQGTLGLIYDLGLWLCEITGLAAATLQPAAGAHGELTGLMMIRAALQMRGNARSTVLLPDSSHGTNPASVIFCGYKPKTLTSNENGMINLNELEEVMDDSVAALMITNPNTLGIFESKMLQIAKLVHDRGGFVYCDGANLSALIGKTKFGDMGIDVAHLNLHKTFSTPHGGGGPGAGPVVVTEDLEPFLPVPVVIKENTSYIRDFARPKSIGRVHSFNGNVGVLIRAASYILTMGAEGLVEATEAAVINANYIRARLIDHYFMPYKGETLHELVISDKWQNEYSVTTFDIAKALIDRGFHPPTIYFPLIAKGALMIEPTETESKETIDEFCDAMIEIAELAKSNPEKLLKSPLNTVRSRLDEAAAARNPNLRCDFCG
ncbi:MAG TPA: aminomethyl-transferring glycine dehydrogenase subunit GcvPB [Nitrospinota bacterium]|nr:aminomethyl-transferring glycine dehydrogenase subunit GcvPB [Nitrospinota bacterium]|tara:strand:+ start:17368 stop:18852 length:1485 start_codon:yes stop_codon:yes gene_type:complete